VRGKICERYGTEVIACHVALEPSAGGVRAGPVSQIRATAGLALAHVQGDNR